MKEYRQLDGDVPLPCLICGETAVCEVADYGSTDHAKRYCADHMAEAEVELMS